jgi:hypothetical protein
MESAEYLMISGDLMLFRGGIKAIQLAGRGPFSHAGTVVRVESGEWFVAEMTAFRGGILTPLKKYVIDYPGQCVVFPLNAAILEHYDRKKAVDKMYQFIGLDYGWHNIWLTGLIHLPIISLLLQFFHLRKLETYFHPDLDNDSETSYPPFCSQMRASIDRFAGVAPVPGLADRYVEPNDLFHSLLYDHQSAFAIYPYLPYSPLYGG